MKKKASKKKAPKARKAARKALPNIMKAAAAMAAPLPAVEDKPFEMYMVMVFSLLVGLGVGLMALAQIAAAWAWMGRGVLDLMWLFPALAVLVEVGIIHSAWNMRKAGSHIAFLGCVLGGTAMLTTGVGAPGFALSGLAAYLVKNVIMMGLFWIHWDSLE